MLNKYPDILTVKQLTEILPIGINKAYELVNKRIIASKRIGRKIIIPKACLVEFIDSARYNISL